MPEYVVYLGPFDTPGAACELRMTVEHKGDYVTSLRAGNQTYVKCPCELPVSTFPVLTPDMGAPDALEGMWIRQLQGMLVDTGRLVEDVQESGQYDATTVAVVTDPDRRVADPHGHRGRRHLGDHPGPGLPELRLLSHPTGDRPSEQVLGRALRVVVEQLQQPRRPQRRVDPLLEIVIDVGLGLPGVQPGQQLLAVQPAQLEQHQRVGLDQPGHLVAARPARGGTGRPRPRRCRPVSSSPP